VTRRQAEAHRALRNRRVHDDVRDATLDTFRVMPTNRHERRWLAKSLKRIEARKRVAK
jgi:hypothetical protein